MLVVMVIKDESGMPIAPCIHTQGLTAAARSLTGIGGLLPWMEAEADLII